MDPRTRAKGRRGEDPNNVVIMAGHRIARRRAAVNAAQPEPALAERQAAR